MPLYLSPLGCSLREKFLSEMTSSCDERTVLLLPSGWLVKNARKQYPSLRGRIMTFDGFLDACGAAKTEDSGLPRLAQEFLLRGLLDDNEFPYFSKIREQQALPTQLAGLISALMRGNVGPAEFVQALSAMQEGDVSEKNREIALLYYTYMHTMDDAKKVDVDMTCYRFVQALESGRASIPFEKIYVADFYAFSALELALLQQTAKQCELSVAMVYENNRERLFHASTDSVEALNGFLPLAKQKAAAADDDFQVWRSVWPEAPKQQKAAITVVEAAGVRQEIAYVAAAIKTMLLDNTALPDEIIVSARDLQTYNGIRDQFVAAGIPVRLPEMAMLMDDPLAAALDSLLRTGSTMRRADLTELVKSPVWSWLGDAGEECEKWLLETTSERVSIEELEAHCPETLREHLAPTLATLSAIPQVRLPSDYIAWVDDWLDQLDWTKRVGAWYQSGNGSLQFVKRAQLAEKAVRAFFEQLTNALQIAGEENKHINIGTFYSWYHCFAKEHSFCLADGDTEGVWVLPAASLTGIGKKIVFLMGVEDETFPKSYQENWLYSQDERKLLADLGVNLGLREQALAEDCLFFASVVSVARERLYLSFNREDNKTPSRYLDAFLHCESCQKILLSSTFPLECADQTVSQGQLAAALSYAGQSWDALKGAALLSPVAALAFASEADRSLEGSAYNGQLLRSEAIALANERNGKLFSVTALEKYYSCPFAYFVEKLLHIAPWQDEAGAVRPELIGSLYHAVLAAFVKRRSPNQDWFTSAKLLMACFQEQKLEMEQAGLLRAASWPFELLEMRRNLLAWLDYDKQVSQAVGGYQQHWLEWGFGQPFDEMTDEHSAPEPFCLETPYGDVNLRGKVDRIDQTPHGLMLLDYKKNAFPSAKARTDGGDLQLMIYLMAVETLLAPKLNSPVLGGAYYSLEGKKAATGLWTSGIKEIRQDFANKRMDLAEWDSFRCATRQLVGAAVDQIYKGCFPAAPLEKCSAFCSAGAFCRRPQETAVEEIMADGD